MSLRIATVAGDPVIEAALTRDLAVRPHVEIVLRCSDRVEFLAAVRSGLPDALVCAGAPAWLDEAAIAEARGKGIPIAGVVSDPLQRLQLEDLGVDVFSAEAGGEVLLAAVRVERESARIGAPSGGGQLVAIWGAKGAPGRTSVAIELAWALARGEPKTLLVDADTYGGDIAQLLDVAEPETSIVGAAKAAARGELVEADLAAATTRPTATGPALLPGILRAELWTEIPERGWQELLGLIRESFAHALFDVGFCLEPSHSPYPDSVSDRNHVARATVAAADAVVAVVRGDPVGIKSFVWAMTHVREVVADEQIVVVVNQVRDQDRADALDVLRRHVTAAEIFTIPPAPDDFLRASTAGRAVVEIAPTSQVSRAVEEVAVTLGAQVPRKGFLARLGGRSG